MSRPIRHILLVTHGHPQVAAETLCRTVQVLNESGVSIVAPPSEWEKHGEILRSSASAAVMNGRKDLSEVGLCLVLGGDGTMLRAFRLTQDLGIPVAGVNLGRVGFLTTVEQASLEEGLQRLLAGDYVEYPLLGLEASLQDKTFRAANDVVVSKGTNPHACSIALSINGVTMFEVVCDGVVASTPAGSSAYSLAAGGPLLGIAVEAYVISFVAPHAVGVRPVVAAPQDVLEIVNADEDNDAYLDVDGQRLARVGPRSCVTIRTSPSMNSLALLRGDSLYHHFRDRLL